MIGKDKSLQERLRNNDKTALDFIYREYKEDFISFSLKYDINYDEIEDVFQDSVIALYQGFVTRQIVLEKSSVKTYLFGIGKNMIFKKFKEQVIVLPIVDDQFEEIEETIFVEPTSEQLLLSKYFSMLSDSCKKILNLYYYRGLTMEEIVEQTTYKDVNTVKSHKSRCLKGLKGKISDHNL